MYGNQPLMMLLTQVLRLYLWLSITSVIDSTGRDHWILSVYVGVDSLLKTLPHTRTSLILKARLDSPQHLIMRLGLTWC